MTTNNRDVISVPETKVSKKTKTPLIRDLITEHYDNLTAAERKLATRLLDDGGTLGLQSINKLAKDVGVSSPTIIRTARKLGFDGFPMLQDAIREEVAAQMKEPLAKLEASRAHKGDDHIISRFAESTADNINRTIQRLDLTEFDNVAKLLSNVDQRLFLLGGRITRANAIYFFNHLQIIRPDVSLLDASPSVWPQSLLDMDEMSTLIIFDIRRYEKELEKLATLVTRQKATVVLFTDQWGSPIEKHASYCFRSMIEAPSSWDSTLAINFLIESLISAIQERSSKSSAERIKAMEGMIGRAKIFGPN